MNYLMKKCQRGFTLIELMIVIAMVGILAAVAIPKFFGQSDVVGQYEPQSVRVPFTKTYNNGAYTYNIKGTILVEDVNDFKGIEFYEITR